VSGAAADGAGAGSAAASGGGVAATEVAGVGAVDSAPVGRATDLPPGTCCCWPASEPNAHCLENRTDQPVTYFVAGSRLPEDEVTYPDIDLHYSRKGGLRTLSHKNGPPYPGWPKAVIR